MYSKFITLVSLALTPISMIVLLSDSLIVQAGEPCSNNISNWVCEWLTSRGVRTGSILPPQMIAKLEDKISQKQAKAIDYILVGYLYAKVGNTLMTETRLNQGLELAKKEGDLKGQAIAARALGEVLVTTGKKQEATSLFTEARNVYVKLGDRQSVTEVNQQLIRLSNQQIQIPNNPSQQIPRPLNLPSERLLNR